MYVVWIPVISEIVGHSFCDKSPVPTEIFKKEEEGGNKQKTLVLETTCEVNPILNRFTFIKTSKIAFKKQPIKMVH